MVSKRRAKELETQEQMEECCPWGDQCTADMQPSDEESESDDENHICGKTGRPFDATMSGDFSRMWS